MVEAETEIPSTNFERPLDIVDKFMDLRQKDPDAFFYTLERWRRKNREGFDNVLMQLEQKLEDPNISKRYDFLSKLQHEIGLNFSYVSFLAYTELEEAEAVYDTFFEEITNPWKEIMSVYKRRLVFDTDLDPVYNITGIDKDEFSMGASEIIARFVNSTDNKLTENRQRLEQLLENNTFSEKTRQFLKSARNSINNSLWILRFFYATEMGGKTVTPEDLKEDMEPINIKDTFEEFLYVNGDLPVEIEAENKSGEDEIITHRPAFAVLVKNFIQNLGKYGGEKGKLTVTKEDGKLKFSFWQENPVSQEDAEKIKKGERLQRDKEGGGYGLEISQYLIFLLGGEFGIQTKEVSKSGSTFFFTLPLVKR